MKTNLAIFYKIEWGHCVYLIGILQTSHLVVFCLSISVMWEIVSFVLIHSNRELNVLDNVAVTLDGLVWCYSVAFKLFSTHLKSNWFSLFESISFSDSQKQKVRNVDSCMFHLSATFRHSWTSSVATPLALVIDTRPSHNLTIKHKKTRYQFTCHCTAFQKYSTGIFAPPFEHFKPPV